MKLRENTITRIGLWLFVMLLCSNAVVGQTASMNYVRKSQMTELYTSNPLIDFENARITIDYYDGLGRPIQTIQQGASGETLDLCTITEYNSYGLPYRQWLPIEGEQYNGSYIYPDDAKSIARTFYNDSHPFTETEYERTMELKESKQYGPGEFWHNGDEGITTHRGLNSKDDDLYGCTRFDVSATGALIKNGTYDAGTLDYEEVRDESNVDIVKFYDLDKRLLLERKVSLYGETLETYYVYNICGLLTYVIPPKAAAIFLESGNGACDSGTVSKLCYHYAYDQCRRMIEKRLPGAESEYLVYDALGNVVLRQDGNLRAGNKWRVMKLDSRYRKAVEGIATLTGKNRESLQNEWSNKLAIETLQPTAAYANKLYYTDTCGIANFEPLVSYFYDNYSYLSTIPNAVAMPADSSYPAGLDNGMGMLTGKAVWEDWYQILTTYRYDDRKRIVLEYENNLDGVYSIHTFSKYNFAGDLTGKKTVYNNTDLGFTYTSEYAYSYNNWGALTRVQHKMNNGAWTTLRTYSYDEVARKSSETVFPGGNSSNSKRTNYGYNLRGWTTSLSSPVFQQSLYYNTTLSGGIPQFDGSLSAMTFLSINSSGTPENFSVTYGYDDFDRLASVNSITAADTQKIFSESFSYDENGNPLVITRGNASTNPIQYISLSYDGNRISSLNESKTSEGLYPDIPSIAKGDYESGWSYDANGNRTADPSRGITSITYNHLNQPLKITFGDGSYIEHKYRSDGTYYGRFERERIISTVNGSTSTSSSLRSLSLTKTGDFILENTIPKRLYIDGGYIDINFNTNTTSYKYYIYDHQGSVRAVLNSSGTVIQSTDYSAYGVPSTRYQMNADNRFHLGLEWQPMKGLYGYYNNARFRDALLAGTFLQQDPLAEKYYPFSPYHYGACNPLKYTDENGKEIRINYNGTDNYVLYKDGALEPQNGLTNIKYPDFVYKVLNDLNTLSNIDGIVSQRLDELQESSQVFNIIESGEKAKGKSSNSALPENNEKLKSGDTTGGIVFYNPDSTTSLLGNTNESYQRPAVVGLAHELLGHCYDYSIGIYFDREEIKSNNVPINEIRAINIENQVRKALGEKIRNSYGGNKIF